tara:strand:- start:4289 stop:6124 length:1836 start_codon:yes stop_codon:yes gene_type:complete
MKHLLNTLLCLIFGLIFVFAQNKKVQDSVSTQKLLEVILTSNRIENSFNQKSKTVQLITSEQIQRTGITHLVDILQQVAGVDVKRRGAGAAQADLNIRGGTFDQTLLLIDGIKLDDAQTGHHTLNFLPPPEMVERIEIIKGPAARAYGLNAFTGAINIVTKKEISQRLSLNLQKGNYDQTNGSILFGSSNKNNNVIGFISKNTSDGYRYNSDYQQSNFFIKSTFNKKKTPMDFITSYSGRKFGANGFYATSSAIDQYEETQASLFAISQRYINGDLIFKPKVYWRRGQDMYEYVRDRPEIYRNLHITNKMGGALDASITSNFGLTGMGIDISKVDIRSNNLGNRNRTVVNFFLEHRFYFLNNKIDITPGLASNYFSDFGWYSFPGIDLGFQLTSELRFYGNLGSTYRIPTFTDLFYSDRTTLGNSNLKPEEANSSELGIHFSSFNVSISLAYFNRKSKNLIDFVKSNEDELWKAENIQEIKTSGVDFELLHIIKLNELTHNFKISYSYLENKLDINRYNFSQYSINNDLKHHFVWTYSLPVHQNLKAFFAYKYVERFAEESYNILDFSARWSIKSFELSIYLNNILNTEYWESNLVTMPKGNGLLGVRYYL